jgi:transposase
MMNVKLTAEEKINLEIQHTTERDGYVRDRIKAVLLASEGWSVSKISQALRLHRDTINRHLKEFEQEKKLSPKQGGSLSKLNEEQSEELITHLECHFYPTA